MRHQTKLLMFSYLGGAGIGFGRAALLTIQSAVRYTVIHTTAWEIHKTKSQLAGTVGNMGNCKDII